MLTRTRRNDAGISRLLMILIALIIAIILLIIYALMASSGAGGDGEPSPSTTETSNGGSTPEATSDGVQRPDNWEDIPAGDRPAPLGSLQPGEPVALGMAPWVWGYVDDTWDVEIWRRDNPAYDGGFEPTHDPYLYQAIYLVAPDGTYLRLYTLRTDVGLFIEAKALEERLVWIMRVYWEEVQTVEFNLATGTASETWSDTGFANVAPITNQDGWFVTNVDELPDGTHFWQGIGYATPLNGVFFRDAGGLVSASAINPEFAGREYYCVGVDGVVAVYEQYTATAGHVSTWPATLLVHDLTADTWTEYSRLGPYGTPCHEDFAVTGDYYIGHANRVDQSGLYRYYFDGRPDEAV